MIDGAVAAPIEADEDEDAPEEPERSSFFAEGDDADERVCETVWRLYVRSSIENGFASRTDAGLDTKKQKFRPKPAATEDPMGETKRGDLQSAVEAAYASAKSRLGRPPTGQELFDEVGEDVGKNLANVRTRAAKSRLALSRLRKGGGASAVPTASSTTKRGPRVHRLPPTTNGAHANGAHEAYEAPPASGHPGALLAVMALQTERTKVAAQLEALDGLIERMRR